MPSTSSEPRESASPGAADAPSTKRRLATQHVREARDRLTSTSGTRPVFDYELLRQFAQNRLSGIAGHPAAGRHHRTAVGAVDRRADLRRMDRRRADHPSRHRQRLPAIPRRAAGHRQSPLLAAALYSARPVLRRGVDLHPHPSARRRRADRHLHAVRHAAGGGDIEHARVEPADRGTGAHLAGDHRHRARFRAQGHAARLHPRGHGARPPRATFRCWPTGCIRRRWPRSRRAPKRTR